MAEHFAEEQRLCAKIDELQKRNAELEAERDEARADAARVRLGVQNPEIVHMSMLRGSIAKLNEGQLRHIYPDLFEDKDRLAEVEHLFEMQWKRTIEAQALWQEETGNEHWADLGKLIYWLMDKAGLPHETD